MLCRFYIITNDTGLFLAVPDAADKNLLAVGLIRPESFAKPSRVCIDEARCCTEDCRGRSVIPLEANDTGTGKIFFEFEDVFHFRTAPAIDRLIVVADTTDIAVLLGEQSQPQILGNVRVLIFVYEHVAKFFLIYFQDVRIVLKYCQVLGQKVAKICGVQCDQSRLIGLIQFDGAPFGKEIGLVCGYFVRQKAAIFPAIYNRSEIATCPSLLVQASIGDYLLAQAYLVIHVENGETGFEANQLRMATKDHRANRVKSP